MITQAHKGVPLSIDDFMQYLMIQATLNIEVFADLDYFGKGPVLSSPTSVPHAPTS
jgi:hypothetical protein